MSIVGLLGHFYVLFSGPFSVASAEYKRKFPNEEVAQIDLCKLCKKSFSFGSGFRRLRFTILVSDGRMKREVQVIYTMHAQDENVDIEFGKDTMAQGKLGSG